MLDAQYKQKYVATYKEIVIVAITFVFILFVLYPKDMLQKQILSEKDNYDLSMLYLKNMLKHDPTNETLMFALAKQSIESGNKDLGYKLLELLKNTKDKQIYAQSYFLRYKLAKNDYYYFKEKNKTKELQKQYKLLKKIFKEIVDKKLYVQNDISQLYKEAIFLEENKSAYLFVKQLLQKDNKDLKLLADAYYLSVKLKKDNEALVYVDRLIYLDKNNLNKWLEAKFFLLMNMQDYTLAEGLMLKDFNERSDFWKRKLIGFYTYHKNYKKSAKLYMDSFKKSADFKEKRDLWLKAIDTLLSGAYIKEAVALGYKYENYFFKDKMARVKLLKLYISSNDLKKASNLSKKILQKRVK
jgi:hypothetical protein